MENYAYGTKPHGSFAAQPARGVYILREPKGEPDVLLLAGPALLEQIYGAADLLSVQGYTARIVAAEDAAVFLQQPQDYQESVFPDYLIARIGLTPERDVEALADLGLVWLPQGTQKQEIAAAALAAIRSAAR